MKCKHLDDGYCLKLSDDTVMQPCIEGPCPFDGAPTNADRIRAMSDEELARVLNGDQDIDFCHRGACLDDETCVGCMLRWLQKPAPEEGEQNV